jgi:hypothetical protein
MVLCESNFNSKSSRGLRETMVYPETSCSLFLPNDGRGRLVCAKPLTYAIRAHFANVPKLGGFPCISNPILNTFAANQSTIAAPTNPVTIAPNTCQSGGGVPEASRANTTNEFTGGTNVIATLSVEFGLCPIIGTSA